ncbi:AMP-binding protein [Micromonospora wenchangensis]|uniref:AMP-binding protein n=1 Tax=Micromonospora wenchangensis TaxID=1185415 RepID=UPI003D75AABA
MANNVRACVRTFGLRPDDTLVLKTPLTFDVNAYEMFSVLAAGACLVVAPPGVEGDPDLLAATVDDYRVTVLHTVPARLRALTETGAFVRNTSLRAAEQATVPRWTTSGATSWTTPDGRCPTVRPASCTSAGRAWRTATWTTTNAPGNGSTTSTSVGGGPTGSTAPVTWSAACPVGTCSTWAGSTTRSRSQDSDDQLAVWLSWAPSPADGLDESSARRLRTHLRTVLDELALACAAGAVSGAAPSPAHRQPGPQR